MDLHSFGVIKCHKCRHILLEDLTIITNNNTTCDLQKCNSYSINNFLYLSDDKLPPWIKLRVESEQWTKGKLICEHCGCRVGSFDYTSGRKCFCGETVLPPVQLVASQIDKPITLQTLSIPVL